MPYERKMNIRVPLEELVVHLLVMPDTLRVEVGRDASWPERHNADIRPYELIAKGVRECLLARLVRVVYGLPAKGGVSNPVTEVTFRIVPSPRFLIPCFKTA